jgi:hypothetical protein
MRGALRSLGIAAFIFVGVTGGLIYDKESIPDNAKVFVIEEYKIWVPNTKWADQIFKEQSVGSSKTERAYENRIESTYSEVKNGKFKGFDLPESWKENEGKTRIVWGKEESLLRSWILPKDKRWNEDGSWNW